MRRREFLGMLGVGAAWPRVARAQPAMPVIGFLDSRPPDGMTERVRAFRQGLSERVRQAGQSGCMPFQSDAGGSSLGTALNSPTTQRP